MLGPEFEFYRSIGVPVRTVYRWKKNRRPNKYARIAWQWFQDGEPFSGTEDWRGWRFFQNELWSPEGESFKPGDLRAYAFQRRNGGVPSEPCSIGLSGPLRPTSPGPHPVKLFQNPTSFLLWEP